MIVAITGGSGSVGRRLVERHIDAGDRVRVLTRRESPGFAPVVETHRGDLASSPDVLSRLVDGADVLYHCAAETTDVRRMTEVNVEGTVRLIAAARHRIGRWVHLGSIAVYGAPEAGVIGEDTPSRPVDEYGRSKAAADRLLIEAAEQGAFACSVVRPAKVFGTGTGTPNEQILFRLFSLVDRGLFFFIGKPGAMTHYVHVENLIDALTLCGRAEIPGVRIFNLSDDRRLEDFIAVIAAALGRPTPTLRLPETPVRGLARVLGWIPAFPLNERRVEALVNRATFPVERIRRELGYTARVPLELGLRELADVWRRRA